MQGRVFYQPGDQGYEATIQAEVARRREEQVAAMLEPELSLAGGDSADPDRGPTTQNRWLQRTLSSTGRHLGQVRDHIFALARVERHELVLDAKAGTGLLTWEAVRRANVGGVWALAANETAAQALRQQANNLETLERPVILVGSVNDPAGWAGQAEKAGAGEHVPEFDVIIGRNLFAQLSDKLATARQLKRLLRPEGRVVVAEVVPKHTQRLHQTVDLARLEEPLVERIAAAEEAIYADPADSMVNWQEADLQKVFEAAGFSQVELKAETTRSERHIEAAQIQRWFDLESVGRKATFAQHLARQGIEPADLAQLRQIFEQQLAEQVISWQSTIVYLVAR
jgi:putative ATPase